MQPTREDKVDFMLVLDQSMSGPLSLKMLYFYKYLLQYGQFNNLPSLYQNLFFYVEVKKFQVYSYITHSFNVSL